MCEASKHNQRRKDGASSFWDSGAELAWWPSSTVGDLLVNESLSDVGPSSRPHGVILDACCTYPSRVISDQDHLRLSPLAPLAALW